MFRLFQFFRELRLSNRVIAASVLAIMGGTGYITLDNIVYDMLQNNLSDHEILNWQFEELQSFMVPPDLGAFRGPLVQH